MAEQNGNGQTARPDASRMRRQRTGPQSASAGAGGVAGAVEAAGVPTAYGPLRHPADVAPMGGAAQLASYFCRAGESGADNPGIPAAPPGNLATWRWMLRDDTIAIARAAVMGPMVAAQWAAEGAEDDTPQRMIDWAQDVFIGRGGAEPVLKPQMIRAMDFGSRSFELILKVLEGSGPGARGGGTPLIGIDKLKALRPEITQVLTDKKTGEYAGLKNGKTELAAEETLHVTYQLEDDDYYGTPRLESCRESAWWPGLYFTDTAGRLGRKVSNIIPIVKGPLSAVDYDETGTEIRGFESAQVILDAVTYGQGVMMESLMAGIDDLRAAPELAKVSPWSVEPFDTGSSASGLPALEVLIRLYDSKKMRGMLVPERTALEGQHGTKSEVAEQADVGLAQAEADHTELLRFVNWHLVDRLLAWNFGERARGQVVITAAPLIDEKRAVFRWVWEALLANPAIVDLLVARLDMQAMAEGLDIPTIDDLNPAMEDVEALAREKAATDVDATKAKAEATRKPPARPAPPGGGGKFSWADFGGRARFGSSRRTFRAARLTPAGRLKVLKAFAQIAKRRAAA